jgi:hypothetical protein
MILLAWLGRCLDYCAAAFGHAADVVYRPYFRHENRKALRESQRQAIEQVIRESRPAIPVRAPIHRDR